MAWRFQWHTAGQVLPGARDLIILIRKVQFTCVATEVRPYSVDACLPLLVPTACPPNGMCLLLRTLEAHRSNNIQHLAQLSKVIAGWDSCMLDSTAVDSSTWEGRYVLLCCGSIPQFNAIMR